jgi:hypothetical protein
MLSDSSEWYQHTDNLIAHRAVTSENQMLCCSAANSFSLLSDQVLILFVTVVLQDDPFGCFSN